jgi:glycosyltransferase involved in cell wall biosynthesis
MSNCENRKLTIRVAFVGPLPPPINGFSIMCSLMLRRLNLKAAVDVFDRAPVVGRAAKTIVQQIIRALAFAFSCLRSRDCVIYLALSGGHGQALDACYVLVGRLLLRRIFIHHHSFAYIDRSSFLNKCFFVLARTSTHIVLSRGMGLALQKRYALDAKKICVVSNAAFFDSPVADHPSQASSRHLRIGFLSNISVEKGFVEFFEIMRRLRGRGVAIDARIAGPVAPSAQTEFGRLLAESPEVHHIGPLYGGAKTEFYRGLDIFVFPTRYANEAEPLVLHEAMQAGAHVIATDRGAIAEILAYGAGVALPADTIVEGAVERIEGLSRDPASLAIARGLSLQQAIRIRTQSVADLSSLLDMLADAH